MHQLQPANCNISRLYKAKRARRILGLCSWLVVARAFHAPCPPLLYSATRNFASTYFPYLRRTGASILEIAMKTVLLLSVLVAGCLCAPQQNPNPYAGITITKQEENNNIGVDGYHYSYEQSDGHKKEETAVIVNQGTDDEALEVTGSFQYQTPDGKTYRVDYKADKDGFHPTITLL